MLENALWPLEGPSGILGKDPQSSRLTFVRWFSHVRLPFSAGATALPWPDSSPATGAWETAGPTDRTGLSLSFANR